MKSNHTAAWPPPPDRSSIEELVRAADPEGHIGEGAAVDEYEPEERDIFTFVEHLPTAELVIANLLPVFEKIWSASFQLDEAALQSRRPALLGLAQQVERFFGPQAQPQTRDQPGK